ncbi:urotensin 1 [Cololabis saira]|uniref:urotensin 1 n=1 Tax=Cololabis saira TaxID=129043 RepID=UPI002AD2CCF8|nr:urotensin 1 [Cololabis saira]
MGFLSGVKPAPLLLLLSSVLVFSHLRPAAGRPRSLPGLPGAGGRLQTQLLQLLLRAAADGAASDLLLSNRVLGFLHRSSPDPESDRAVLRRTAAAQQLRRGDEAPLSIDLTFHLLRNMIQMAKTESQREQAQVNRKVFDEVGK